MVLIFSQKSDYSTGEVVNWLRYFGVPFLRINEFKELTPFSFYIGSKFTNNSSNKFIDSITSVWYRRDPDFSYYQSDKINAQLESIIMTENSTAFHGIFSLLKNKYWLNDPITSKVNKISVLEAAVSVGLNIPPTLITSSKEELTEFLKIHKCLINKPIYEVRRIFNDKFEMFQSDAFIIDNSNLKNVSRTFSTSLFQKYIDKKYELRIVYLEGILYPMAIYSQKNAKTKYDFRNYDYDHPNRFSPIFIPETLTQKLTSLMKTLKLNFGSIDIVLNRSNEYIFLEVNPVGQFGMTSTPCNYMIDREVARIFKKQYEQK